ncbi:MGMT family protein [Calothrix sp. NIES-3974]|uniref:MGMT family protein n=1 Tax=Calothrix sp. NIES-3974 TaxID=2005462 RepID=UPI000B621FF7|nr:MGMT family protein [Calothrix sp. NIES-3974]BAZ06501.1 putative methyltransferase [Calothrix sp. NIES-3974]
MSSYEKIYAVVRKIPYGKVATYGQVAELSGLAGKARVVGYALFRVDLGITDVPWHRVVNYKGEISYSPLRNGADKTQRVLLEEEGIEFNDKGKINLHKYLWRGI